MERRERGSEEEEERQKMDRSSAEGLKTLEKGLPTGKERTKGVNIPERMMLHTSLCATEGESGRLSAMDVQKTLRRFRGRRRVNIEASTTRDRALSLKSAAKQGGEAGCGTVTTWTACSPYLHAILHSPSAPEKLMYTDIAVAIMQAEA